MTFWISSYLEPALSRADEKNTTGRSKKQGASEEHLTYYLLVRP
jgi:hypothetical protein